MFDSFVLLAPVLLLVAVALLCFVGCEIFFQPEGPSTEPEIITWLQNRDNDPALIDPTNQVTTPPFTASLQQGNLIVVWIFYASNVESVSQVMDTAGSVYQRAVGPTTGQGTLAQYRQEIWWAANIPAASGVTVTATFSDAFNNEKAISAHEYQGAEGIAPNGSASRVGNEANASVGPVAVPTSGLLFAAGIFATGATRGVDFDLRSNLNTNNVAEDRRFANEGDYTAAFQNVAQDYVAQAIVVTPKYS